MPGRLGWTRMDTVGLGVLLAAVLGAWQAAQVADVLGFGPGGEPGAPSRPSGDGEQPRQQGRAVRPGREGAGALQERARTDAGRWPAQASAWTSDAGARPRDLAGPIATGLAPPESEAAAVARAAEEYRRLIRDLEFSPGLPEPRQQRLAALPEPWRPDPETSGRPPPVIEAVSPTSADAAGGAEVTIRGQNLRAAQVMFGAVAARVASVSPGQVTVVVPPSTPGQVRIALTNDDGHFALAPVPFTLRPVVAAR